MVETQSLQHGGVQIMHVDPVFDRLNANFIGCANTWPPRTPTPAGHIVNP
jgi:hypothetical protein